MPMVETMLNSTMQTSHGLISTGFILAVAILLGAELKVQVRQWVGQENE